MILHLLLKKQVPYVNAGEHRLAVVSVHLFFLHFDKLIFYSLFITSIAIMVCITIIHTLITQHYSNGYAINIHRGSFIRRSSEGCQTVYPDEWLDFQQTAYKAMDKVMQEWIRYLLIEQ